MQVLWNIPLTEIRAGDVWTSDNDDVAITAVEPPRYDTIVNKDMVRFHGHVVRGYGKSNKVHTWHFPADMTIDVERVVTEPFFGGELDGPIDTTAKGGAA